jgi:hypothetical protein
MLETEFNNSKTTQKIGIRMIIISQKMIIIIVTAVETSNLTIGIRFTSKHPFQTRKIIDLRRLAILI